jgi:hypothetical protein
MAGGSGHAIAGAIGQTAANVRAPMNARLCRPGAERVTQTDFDDAQRRKARLMLGEATATGASSGVAITSGSPLLHELDRVKQTEIEARNIRAQGTNAAATTRFRSRIERGQIPFQIMGGGAQGGSILSSYAAGK